MAKDKKIVTAFGRMNPPTTGHQKLVDAVLNKAKADDADHDIRLSHSQDAKKNPLTQDQKLSHARKMFPGVIVQRSIKSSLTSIINLMVSFTLSLLRFILRVIETLMQMVQRVCRRLR